MTSTDGGEHDTWCLGLYPTDESRTRLVSRWRPSWPRTPATMLWLLISEPGSFIMERKMLLGIKDRVERAGSTVPPADRAALAIGLVHPPASGCCLIDR